MMSISLEDNNWYEEHYDEESVEDEGNLSMSGDVQKGKLPKDKNYLEACVEYLKEIKPETRDGYGTGNYTNAYYGGYSANGDYFRAVYACHAKYRWIDFKTDVTYTKWNPNRDSKYEKANKHYFDWITDRDDSPWKEAIPVSTKVNGEDIGSKEFMWNHGFVFTNTDVLPSNVHHQFNVAARMPKEWPDLVLLWYNLVTCYGYTREWAFAFITIWLGTDHYKGFLKQKEFKLSLTNWYDYPLDLSTCDEQYVLNFLKGIMVGPRNKPFKESTQYTPVNALWGNNGLARYVLDGNKNVINEKCYTNILEKLYRSKYGNGEPRIDSFGKQQNATWIIKDARELIALGLEEQDRLYSIIHKEKKHSVN